MPVGLLSVAAAVRAAGHSVRIIDFEFEHRIGCGFAPDEPVSTFVNRIAEHPASVVGITVLADTLPTALAIGRYLKRVRPEVRVVLGGPGIHGTARAVAARFAECVDYLCIADGESALLALLESDLDLLGDVPGMLTVGSGTKVQSAPSVRIDALPFPAYDLVDVPAYLAIASPRIFDLHVGSGCTYKCSFCTTAPFWKHVFSARSPGTILAEMERLSQAYGISDFNIIHDNFVNDRRYIDAFVAYFAENNTRFSWGCAVRPDNVPLDLMKRMRTAGCRFLFCGTDAGDAAILRDMRKMTSSAKSYRFFRDAREADLVFETNTIIGYPNEDDDALEAALKIVFDAIAHGGYTADVSVLQPLPGAPVTMAHRDRIEPTFGSLQTYLPVEARDLITEHGDVFTGFGFIRQANMPYEYYTRLAELIRYFTRHFFRSIYFLKEIMGVPYRVALEGVAGEISPSRYGERLSRFAEDVGASQDELAAFRSVYCFEAGIEAVKGVDVVAEISNVYARPTQNPETARVVVVDIDHEVHLMFAALPRIETAVRNPVSYLFRREGGDVASIRLKDWQRELWQTLGNSLAPPQAEGLLSNEWASRLAARTGASFHSAYSAVAATLQLFSAESLKQTRCDSKPCDQSRRAWSENDKGSCGLSAGI
ncbi:MULTISPECIES: B12-binding domain-containing radical SAM protein [Xanthobacter]|uniref:B12-binding domain-containing radical SAM protein n=1 Tax=Xanthobacter TaxID=279 RepID=UPI001EDE8799|nr:radical SAM protein [Xanthobacter sp. NM-25]